jgi:hypothetical protein
MSVQRCDLQCQRYVDTVTMDRYGGLFPRLDEAIAERLDSVFRAACSRPERSEPVALEVTAGS